MDRKYKFIIVGVLGLILFSLVVFVIVDNKTSKLEENKVTEVQKKNEDIDDNAHVTEEDRKDELSIEETSKNDDKLIEDNKDNDSKEDKTTNKEEVNSVESNKENDIHNSISEPNKGDNQSENKDDKKEEEVTPEPVVVDENDVYRKKLENTYGIKIKYGEEIGDYKPQRLTPTKLLDSNKIKTNLGYMETELKKYPTGFFKDFSGMPVTFYLVESVPNNAFSGFTDKQFMNDIKITVVDSFSFSYTLNHEIMHYIDAYLELKLYPSDPFRDYMVLNPVGFSYGSAQEQYNYGYNGQTKGAYFLNSYAQSDVREDRAEIFKQMMTRVYKPVGMFDDGEIMKQKALIISEQIKTYFPSASGTQYWDKIIG